MALKKSCVFSVFDVLLICFLSGMTAYAVVHFSCNNKNIDMAKPSTRWEEVKARGTLRCGYLIWPPFVERNMNTGEMEGSTVAIVEKMAANLALKVEWSTEVDMAHMLSGFNKYDMVCSPLISNSFRARESDFTVPLGYIGTYAWVRQNEDRFGDSPVALNDPQVRIAVIDGESSQEVAKEDFPKATLITLPHVAAGGQLMMEVAGGKADVVLTEAFSMELYEKGNPGQIRALSKTPVRLSALAFPLPPNEYEFKRVLDIALGELQETGMIERILRPYENEDGMAKILLPAKLYRD